MKKILLLLIIPFLFVGCSDDDVADDEINLIGDGSHEFEISGYLSISSVGEASFTHALDKTENTGPQSVLGINFYGNDEEVLITALIGVPNDASGVKAGTYTVQLENVEGETQVIVGMLGPEILLG